MACDKTQLDCSRISICCISICPTVTINLLWSILEILEYCTTEAENLAIQCNGIEAVRKELADRGVAVISNVLSQADCDTHIRNLHDWLGTFGDNFPVNINSVIHKYGAAHLEPCWRVRLQVKAVFEKLWGTEKLLTSTDALAIGRPPSDPREHGERISRKDLHFDQGPHRQGLHAYQGAVYLEDATEEDWCFVVMERSNQYHEEFFKKHKQGRTEHRKLSDKEIDFLKSRGCRIQRVGCPKGGIILWDSRTVHAGAKPVYGRANPDRWRYIIFVSQSPAIWASQKDIAVKHDAYYNRKCGHHWSSTGSENFENGPKTQQDILTLPVVAETEEAKLLAGVEPYDFYDGSPNGPTLDTEHGAVFDDDQ